MYNAQTLVYYQRQIVCEFYNKLLTKFIDFLRYFFTIEYMSNIVCTKQFVPIKLLIYLYWWVKL